MPNGKNPRPDQAMIGHIAALRMACPNCGLDLQPTRTDCGLTFDCTECHGHALSTLLLPRILGDSFTRNLLDRAKAVPHCPGKDCPECRQEMSDIAVFTPKAGVHLDVCARCKVVWFDCKDFDSFPDMPKAVEPIQLSPQISEAVAQAFSYSKELETESAFGADYPESAWQWIPAFLNLPVKMDAQPADSRPWVTWGLGALLAMIFVYTLPNLAQVVQDFGLIPADPWRRDGLTLLTYFFLHGGIGHIIVNVYFLLIFGDDVEKSIGSGRYVGLIVLAALVSAAAHIAFDPRANMPCVGASGGISGVIAYYALTYPKARIGMRYYVLLFYMPAYVWFFIWIGLQLLIAREQLAGAGNVSALAHLGGVTVGATAWLLGRIWPKEEAADTP
jgi:membrane associated rhomboid family serine protease